MRVALYVRVSTDEQARHGFSIETQLHNLREWAKRENHTIVGEYVDAGISGKKPPSKRPELSRLFADLEAGVKIDVLAFCKLDRFFRSVKLYYQAVEVLERYHVAWIAIQEDYETLTASGRFKVNIMLSVAENEADRTSERIKTVFEHKVEKGEAINGSLPLGLKIENKRVVPDENAQIVRDVFERYIVTKSKVEVMQYIHEKHGIRIWLASLNSMLRNPLYRGEYRGNVQYCQPIISAADFDAVQELLSTRDVRINQTGRVYLFSGLIRCAECGKAMAANYKTNKIYYRCHYSIYYHLCEHKRSISESKIEQMLLATVVPLLEESAAEWEVSKSAAQKKPAPSGMTKEQAEKKIARLKELYVNDLISLDEYKADREKLLAAVKPPAPEPPRVDLAGIRAVLDGGAGSLYSGMTPKQKRSLWQSIIREIRLNKENEARIFFK